MKSSIREHIQGYTLILPWVLTFGIFWMYPLLYALVVSFHKYYTLSNTMEWVGLQNYSAVFEDPMFWKALSNTTIFTFGTVPITTSLALLLAIILNAKSTRLKEFFRAAYFMPTVTSLVVIALVFTNLYAKDGYVNALCMMIGIPHPELGWLLEPTTALGSIMAMDVWMSTGYYMVLFLAGLQSIPNDLYESAELSGASSATQFWRITLPLLRPTMLFVVVVNSIKSFQIFVEIYVMTKGGPLEGTTTTLVYEVYKNAFMQSDQMGYASALAYIVFLIILVMSMIQMRVLKSKP